MEKKTGVGGGVEGQKGDFTPVESQASGAREAAEQNQEQDFHSPSPHDGWSASEFIGLWTPVSSPRPRTWVDFRLPWLGGKMQKTPREANKDNEDSQLLRED